MPSTTPIYLFPYPLGTEAADGPNGIGDLAKRVETVLQAQINALDARLDVLEAAGPAGLPNSVQLRIGSFIPPASGAWTDILTTPTLNPGKWLVMGQAQLKTSAISPGITIVRLIGSLSGVQASAQEQPIPTSGQGTTEVSVVALFATTSNEIIRFQVSNNKGDTTVCEATEGNPQGHNATTLVWTRLAP